MHNLKGDDYLKRIISVLLCVIFVFALIPIPAAHAEGNCRAVIGADLTEDQVNAVYAAFGVQRGSVTQLTMTNGIERYYLDGYVDSSIIGTRSISCVYLELLPEGSGMDVVTSNIGWVTPEMYISALASAGITDAKIVVAAPIEVSGTAALAGIYWAYEDLTGIKIDDTDKLISTQQLTITGDLAKTIGSRKLRSFAKQNIYNRKGDAVRLKLALSYNGRDEIFDSFGDDVTIIQNTDGTVDAYVTVSDSEGLYDWLMKHGRYFTVLEPTSVRENLVERLKNMLGNYDIPSI